MNRLARWVTMAARCLAAGSVAAATHSALEVRLSAATPVLRGDVAVVVTVNITNTSRHPVNLLRWQLPAHQLEGALFRITRDGEAVAHTGPLIKRTAPDATDRLRIEPGAALQYQVELTSAYDLSRSGRYAIEYTSRGSQGAAAAALRSDPLYLWLEGRSGQAAKAPTPPPAGPISYTGNGSASQQTALQTAVGSATSYAVAANTCLGGRASATARYQKWLGAFSSVGWGTGTAHFTAVQDAFQNKALTLDCKCKKQNVYACVYPTQPYKIYLCGAFWAAPNTGTDSRAGTLIHEMTHFNVVASTDGWAYGQTAAASLAITDPAKALDNADSHEYFAENSPALP